jgi:hypothetical protein
MARNNQIKIADQELIFQNYEKHKLEAELIIAKEELKRTKDHQKECVQGLEEIMFITQKLRQPITQIVGLSILLTDCENSQGDLNRMINVIQNSAKSLDNFSRELTKLIHHKKLK